MNWALLGCDPVVFSLPRHLHVYVGGWWSLAQEILGCGLWGEGERERERERRVVVSSL